MTFWLKEMQWLPISLRVKQSPLNPTWSTSGTRWLHLPLFPPSLIPNQPHSLLALPLSSQAHSALETCLSSSLSLEFPIPSNTHLTHCPSLLSLCLYINVTVRLALMVPFKFQDLSSCPIIQSVSCSLVCCLILWCSTLYYVFIDCLSPAAGRSALKDRSMSLDPLV